MDTAINTVRDDSMYCVSTDERWMITMISKAAAKCPDEVIIKQRPENNDGCLVAWVPKRWVKIKPPRQLSEEQKRENATRLRESKANVF